MQRLALCVGTRKGKASVESTKSINILNKLDFIINMCYKLVTKAIDEILLP